MMPAPGRHAPARGHGGREERGRPSAEAGIGRWLGIAALVLVVDQLSKLVIEQWFFLGERLVLVPGLLDLTLVYNRGAAFSFLAGAGGWQRWFFTGIGLVASWFIVRMLKRAGENTLFALALALILGGALGNVIDRLARGQVVDFIVLHWQQYHWPAFNVADSAITIGAVLLVIDELRRVKKQSPRK